jgi:hypothetical protein
MRLSAGRVDGVHLWKCIHEGLECEKAASDGLITAIAEECRTYHEQNGRHIQRCPSETEIWFHGDC